MSGRIIAPQAEATARNWEEERRRDPQLFAKIVRTPAGMAILHSDDLDSRRLLLLALTNFAESLRESIYVEQARKAAVDAMQNALVVK